MFISSGIAPIYAGKLVQNIHRFIGGREQEWKAYPTIEDFLAASSLGWFGAIHGASKYWGGGYRLISGPVGKKAEVITGTVRGIVEGDFRAAGRNVVGEIPYVGKPAKGYLFRRKKAVQEAVPSSRYRRPRRSPSRKRRKGR